MIPTERMDEMIGTLPTLLTRRPQTVEEVRQFFNISPAEVKALLAEARARGVVGKVGRMRSASVYAARSTGDGFPLPASISLDNTDEARRFGPRTLTLPAELVEALAGASDERFWPQHAVELLRKRLRVPPPARGG